MVDISTPVPWSDGGALDRVLRTQAAAAELARRRAELAGLEDVPTVRAALRRAFLSGAIGRAGLARHRAAYAGAKRAARVLSGARADEERTVLASVDALAAEGRLVPSRLPAVFLNLRRNTRTWTQAPFPATGERRTFGRHPAVFQYVPGHGMQLHPLATWACSTRGCARACGGSAPRGRCGGGSTRSRGSPRTAAGSPRGSTTTRTRRAIRRG